MTFLVIFKTPGLGSYTFRKEAQDKRQAQRAVIESFVKVGCPIEKIGIHTSGEMLEIGINRILIVPVKEFNEHTAKTLIALF